MELLACVPAPAADEPQQHQVDGRASRCANRSAPSVLVNDRRPHYRSADDGVVFFVAHVTLCSERGLLNNASLSATGGRSFPALEAAAAAAACLGRVHVFVPVLLMGPAGVAFAFHYRTVRATAQLTME